MKPTLLAGASLLTLSIACSPANATMLTYTGGFQTYTVATTGLYDILAAGAQGGDSKTDTGGNGAIIGGEFSLTAGDVLTVAVGGMGGSGSIANVMGGGGGGSFVILQGGSYTPLVIAGGGGGAGWNALNGHGGYYTGTGGQTGTSGGNGFYGHGGKNGYGGSHGHAFGAAKGGGGGGGLKSNGSGHGGYSYVAGLGGAAGFSGFGNGGFGGGGGGGYGAGGGGGGGYSGGGGGDSDYAGGGGGSFDGGTNQVLTAGANPGNGYVSIDLLSATKVPEPGTLALLAGGLAGLGAARRRRRKRAKALPEKCEAVFGSEAR